MPLPTIQYPYLPAGCTYTNNVSADHPFMLAAKAQRDSAGCRKHATGAVIVKDGQVVAAGANAGIHVTICPRVYKGYGTGEGYRYCKDYCQQDGHAEVMAVRDARQKGIDVTGADVYLYGHWWACKNCWDTMQSVGITNVFVTDNAHDIFNDQARHPGDHERVDLKLYVSGPLTNLKDPTIKAFYEGIAKVAEGFGFETYVPHLYTDPELHLKVTAEDVYAYDGKNVREADVLVCYVGEPSLGVGIEIEMAARHKCLVVLLSERGTKISRMVLGSPAVIDHIEFDSRADAFAQLTGVFEKLVKTAKRKNQSSL